MKKAETLRRWASLPAESEPLRHMTAIPYKSTGSRYGACGIRIDGNPEFIDAILSRLKDLLDGENHVTRLELARNAVDRVEIAGNVRTFGNADRNAEVCYIRLHERGHEGKIGSAIFDRHLDAGTDRFLASKRGAK